jgi:nitrogen fixation/metabolism regulation signal transduction histidine kinase
MSEATSNRPAPGKHHRSAKNYLLDRRFQLKYTGFLVAIALVLSAGLGALLWRTSDRVIEQSRESVKEGQAAVHQGQETVKRGEALIVESRKVRQVVEMTAETCYKNVPEVKEQFAAEAARDEEKLKKEQDRLTREAADLEARAGDLAAQATRVETQQRRVLIALVAGLSLLVVLIGFAGIIFTHKVAGPIFKMKRLLREVGAGKLIVREKLRKGDELLHFFEAFEHMVGDLRKRQEQEISKVDEIIARLEGATLSNRGLKELDEDGIALLKKLRKEMKEQLDA